MLRKRTRFSTEAVSTPSQASTRPPATTTTSTTSPNRSRRSFGKRDNNTFMQTPDPSNVSIHRLPSDHTINHDNDNNVDSHNLTYSLSVNCPNTTLRRLRNMWEFANLVQFLFLFGRAININDVDIEKLEYECISETRSSTLKKIGMSLLKFIVTNRCVSVDTFDAMVARQFASKSPSFNPFLDTGEQAVNFEHLSLFTQIRVLQKLTSWVWLNPERLREIAAPDKNADHTLWRIESLGIDRQNRIYFYLDDERLYRQTDTANKRKTTKSSCRKRTAKSRRSRTSKTGDETQVCETTGEDDSNWECIAISLKDYEQVIEKLSKSNEGERVLRHRLIEDVLPIIQDREDARRKEELKRLKEAENQMKMANAKRSSRLASKRERVREAREIAEAERQREHDAEKRREEEVRFEKLDEVRKERVANSENLLKQRLEQIETGKAEIKRLEAECKNLDDGQHRTSERQYRSALKKLRVDVTRLEELDNRIFDCSFCGQYDRNYDRECESMACEKCGIWQHMKCQGWGLNDESSKQAYIGNGECKFDDDANENLETCERENPREEYTVSFVCRYCEKILRESERVKQTFKQCLNFMNTAVDQRNGIKRKRGRPRKSDLSDEFTAMSSEVTVQEDTLVGVPNGGEGEEDANITKYDSNETKKAPLSCNHQVSATSHKIGDGGISNNILPYCSSNSRNGCGNGSSPPQLMPTMNMVHYGHALSESMYQRSTGGTLNPYPPPLQAPEKHLPQQSSIGIGDVNGSGMILESTKLQLPQPIVTSSNKVPVKNQPLSLPPLSDWASPLPVNKLSPFTNTMMNDGGCGGIGNSANLLHDNTCSSPVKRTSNKSRGHASCMSENNQDIKDDAPSRSECYETSELVESGSPIKSSTVKQDTNETSIKLDESSVIHETDNQANFCEAVEQKEILHSSHQKIDNASVSDDVFQAEYEAEAAAVMIKMSQGSTQEVEITNNEGE